MPQVSVLLPVYNGQDYLVETLNSVLSQSLRDIEIIAVDDGSTDATAAILQDWAAKDGRIRYVSKSNSGISDTLNIALAHAASPLVARIDADDVMEPMRLERQVAFLSEHPEACGTGSYYSLINETGRRCGEVRPLPGSVEELQAYLAGGGKLRYTHPTLLFKLDAARQAGGYRREFEPCEDVDLFLRMVEARAFIIIQPEFLTRYRVHAGSISTRSAARQHRMLGLVFANYDARRCGQDELSLAAFEHKLADAPLPARILDRADYWSEMLYRRHTQALMAGRVTRSRLMLMGAAALKPRRAFSRAMRVARRMVSARSP
jgi:glycosyltransferase involved in cell wall biosynthesis